MISERRVGPTKIARASTSWVGSSVSVLGCR